MNSTNGRTKFIENIFNKIPVPIFIVNKDLEIVGLNAKAEKLGRKDRSYYYNRRGGDALSCIHSFEKIGGCGTSSSCSDCAIRNTFNKALRDNREYQVIEKMVLVYNEKENRTLHALVTAAPIEYEGEQYIVLTLEDIGELISLRQLIPICANCKSIRDDENFWQSVEKYIERFTDFTFSHGICPDCMKELYPEFNKSK